LVRERTAKEGVVIDGVDDGLEAACQAYPELNLETSHISGDNTYVIDPENDVMYVVTKVK
jgi:hypothetical protein